MNSIHLTQTWKYYIATGHKGMRGLGWHLPGVQDEGWPSFLWGNFPDFLHQHPPENAILWLRTSFEMPPNDACVTWWLVGKHNLPPEAEIWVNYEHLPLAVDLTPPGFDITYAIAMGKNTLAMRLTLTKLPSVWPNLSCEPRPCH